jgi:uncharacterized membrane protein (UPF0182 family)
MNIWLTLYLAIAALVTAGAFYGGVVNRRPVKLFTEAEYVILGLTTILVGLVWPLFVPGLTVVAVRNIRRYVDEHGLGWFAGTREARARG